MILQTTSIFSGLQKYVFSLITEKFGQQLRIDLFTEIMKKDMEFFDSRKTGDLCSRLQSDISKIENAISNQFAVLVSSTIYLIICIFILFFISTYMTLFTIGIILPMIIIGPLYGGYLRKLNKKISDVKAESTDIC